MIRVIFIMLIGIVISANPLHACDACGCSAGNMGIGLMANYKNNFIRFSYLDVRYNSNPSHDHYNSNDLFTQYNLSFRYSLKKLPKFRFEGHIPYAYNIRKSDEGLDEIIGFSDTRLSVNYAVFNNLSIDENQSFYMEVGSGIMLPTGKYEENLLEVNLPDNFNVGKGAYGVSFQVNSIYSFENVGIVFNGSYQFNSKSKGGYKFGNESGARISVFKDWKWRSISLIPSVGFIGEHIGRNLYENGNKVPETGGLGMFLSSAINIKSDEWMLGTSFSNPLIQQYSNGAVNAGNRIAAHFSYLF